MSAERFGAERAAPGGGTRWGPLESFVRYPERQASIRGSRPMHARGARAPAVRPGADYGPNSGRSWSANNGGAAPGRSDSSNRIDNRLYWRRHNYSNLRQISRDYDDEWRHPEGQGRSYGRSNSEPWADREWSEGERRPQPWSVARQAWLGRDSQHHTVKETTLPEWAVNTPVAGAGTFSSSGVFHGYSKDESSIPKTQASTYQLTRSHTHSSFVASKAPEEGFADWRASQEARKLSSKRFDVADIEIKKHQNIATSMESALPPANTFRRLHGGMPLSSRTRDTFVDKMAMTMPDMSVPPPNVNVPPPNFHVPPPNIHVPPPSVRRPPKPAIGAGHGVRMAMQSSAPNSELGLPDGSAPRSEFAMPMQGSLPSTMQSVRRGPAAPEPQRPRPPLGGFQPGGPPVTDYSLFPRRASAPRAAAEMVPGREARRSLLPPIGTQPSAVKDPMEALYGTITPRKRTARAASSADGWYYEDHTDTQPHHMSSYEAHSKAARDLVEHQRRASIDKALWVETGTSRDFSWTPRRTEERDEDIVKNLPAYFCNRQRPTAETSSTEIKKEEKQSEKELEKEKKRWIEGGFTIFKGAGKSTNNQQESKTKIEEVKNAEEVKRQKKEDDQLALEEKKKQLSLSKKQQEQRSLLTESMVRRAPWSMGPAVLPLPEIQQLERKRLKQVKEQQRMRHLFARQQGKGKKSKKNKMLKVDAGILGFSVTAAEDRINVGAIDTV